MAFRLGIAPSLVFFLGARSVLRNSGSRTGGQAVGGTSRGSETSEGTFESDRRRDPIPPRSVSVHGPSRVAYRAPARPPCRADHSCGRSTRPPVLPLLRVAQRLGDQFLTSRSTDLHGSSFRPNSIP
jgi:hypothetical protein